MCGRYTLYQIGKLPGRFSISPKKVKELTERYNIAPSQSEPTIFERDGKRELELMKWGLMTPWMKEAKDVFKYKTFNVRAETMFEKPMWKASALHHRCIVPSNGFYEWCATSSGKQPYFIKPSDQDLFGFAGIFSNWKDSEGQEWGTYSIVTTEPNKEMTTIHNRMPVILQPKDEDLWLDSSNDSPEFLKELTKPYKDGGLEIVEVSRDVNNSRSQGAGLITPMNSQ